ncbi:MAG TPA: hypothetical protein RMF84_11255, partial [Polyangiaceae bacterium LLY-WYZ-14_1]|nr:hypothetical protein [Polyangiaceae bacterium LLY-WYZ-14_1]
GDAGRPDVETDGGPLADASGETGDGGAPRDGGGEAAPWALVDGFEDGCVVERSTAPETSGYGIHSWVPCTDVNGCLRLEPPPDRGQILVEDGARAGSDTFGFLAEAVAGIDITEQPRVVSLARIGGPPREVLRDTPSASWRNGEICSIIEGTVADETAVLSSVIGYREIQRQRFYRVPLDGPPGRWELIGSLRPRGIDFGTDVAASEEAIVVTRTPATAIVTFDEAGQEVTLSGFGTELEGTPLAATAVGPFIYWIQAAEGQGTLWRARGADLESREALDPFPDQSVAFFWSDGDWALWMIATDPETGTVDFYTGRYDPDPAAWSPEHLVQTSDLRAARAAEHTLVTVSRSDPTVFRAYRLDRRTVAEITVTPEMRPQLSGVPIYVSDDEFAVDTRRGDYRILLADRPTAPLDP